MRRAIIYLLIFVLLLVTPTGLRYLKFHDLGSSDREPPPLFNPENIGQVPTPPATDFVDDPEVGKGIVLLDEAHRNNFDQAEIAHLDGRLAARGYKLQGHTSGDLATALRAVSAYVVIAPLDNYVEEDIRAVADFVRHGGRLLLVGDPTRFNIEFEEEDEFSFNILMETDEIPLNSLANQFDLIFVGDYLYNTLESEGNFRNIILSGAGFAEDDLLDGIERLVFYSTHSVQVGPGGETLVDADENTWSSATDRPGGLSLVAASEGGRVIAMGDIHFLMDPYYTVHDNGRFIANIADFLVEPFEREFMLADFPYFYDDDVDLHYAGSPELGPDAFDEIIMLQEAFRGIEKELELVGEAQPDSDALYLGLYNQSEELLEILASYGISLTIEPPVLTMAETQAMEDEANGDEEEVDDAEEEDSAGEAEEEMPVEEQVEEIDQLIHSSLGTVQMSGTALILLDEMEGNQSVIVLAASKAGLEQTVGRLLDMVPMNAGYTLSDCLLQANMAFCPTNVADEEVEAELITGGVPESTEEPDEEDTGSEDAGDDEDSEDDEEIISEELDSVEQGTIQIDETVQADLAEDESHTWTFDGGPVTIDIVLSSAELDTVLELYGPDNELIDSVDNGFAGDDEALNGVVIPDSDEYSILVKEFFGDSGSYTLTVSLADEGGQTGSGILIFGDDDGVAISTGFTDVGTLAGLLAENYAVTTWLSTQDGPLGEVSLEDYELVVWDSGDYRDEEGFLGEDTFTILDYLESGGSLFIVGASPTLLSSSELAPLADVEVLDTGLILTDDLTDGEIIALDQVYETVSLEPLDVGDDEDSEVFLSRGPESGDSGGPVGIVTVDNTQGEQRTAMLLAPFTAFPANVQSILLMNLMAWFGLSGS